MKDILINTLIMHTLEDPEAEEYIGKMLDQQQSYDLDQQLIPNGQQSVYITERAVTVRGRQISLSTARKTFLILVGFDMVLTFIIWCMYCQVLFVPSL